MLKGVYKNLNILVGLIFGYILSIIFTVAGIAPMVDFSGIQETIDQVGFFSIPKLVFFTSHKPVFNLGSFLTIAIVFLVSAAETTGATTAVCTGALGRDLKMDKGDQPFYDFYWGTDFNSCFFVPATRSIF